MIREIREIGRVNTAPILIMVLELAKKDWVALAYKNNLEKLSFFSWSARDQDRVSTSDLVEDISKKVKALGDAIVTDGGGEALFDIQYEQPVGWDRWLGGVPRPMRNFFDETLHPKLRTKLDC